MVAITVILAAVIGAFVLEIGDQQETAPSTSFDSEQYTTLKCATNDGSCDANDWARANLTELSISHAGGNVVDISNVKVKVDGNASVYGSVGESETDYTQAYPNHYPVPDVGKTLGTNKKVEFSSGQAWVFHSVGAGEETSPGLSHENWIRIYENVQGEICPAMKYANGNLEHAYFHQGKCNWGPGNHKHLDPLQQEDQVNVVWTASSGGKTQTLFKYTVQ
jgi:hypothetical protein